MTNQLLVSAALTLALMTSAVWGMAPLPFPPRPLGLFLGVQGGPGPTCTVQMFLDPTCPDSRYSFRQLRPLLTQTDLLSRIHFRLLLFPLPFHRASFLTCTAVKAAENLANTTVAIEFLSKIFDQQKNFSTASLVAKNDNDVMGSLASLGEPLGLGKTNVMERMKGGMSNDVIMEFKIGCSRGVTQVPAFFINDIPAPQAADWDKDDWAWELARLCNS